LGLKTQDGSYDWGINQTAAQNSKSTWFFSQDITTNTTKFDPGSMQKLFRFEALNDGVWSSKHIKVSISDHRAPTDVDPYGSFTVTFRHTKDSDASPRVLEKFSSCNLNPNSANYVAAKIGDMYQEWDEGQNRYRVYGNHANQSRFLRIIMNEDVDQGITDPSYLPFGFYGPIRYKTWDLTPKGFNPYNGPTGSTRHPSSSVGGTLASPGHGWVMTSGSALHGISKRGLGLGVLEGAGATEANKVMATSTGIFNSFLTGAAVHGELMGGIDSYGGIASAGGGQTTATASVVYPSLPLRISSSADGIPNQKKAHFGISVSRTPSTTRFDESYYDVVAGGKGLGRGRSNKFITPVTDVTEHSFIFTLDDIVAVQTGSLVGPESVKSVYYASGSRLRGNSYTALRSSWTDLVDSGFTKFTAPMVGGFDGLDIHEREPFGDHIIGASGVSFKGNYAAHSLKRAIDSVSDPEVVETNLITVPGVRTPLVTNHVIDVAEDRADALAVIDIEKGGYAPATETTDSFKTRITNNSVREAITTLKNRGINSSYACTYFPWVKIYDEINDTQVWVPPSVVALGTFASTERNSELWFAPAGFTRGGLSEGSAGLPVLTVSQRLSSKDRDKLYDQNINPIATFPAEGIVIFGQKTLQSSRSALDRINVRRLMIFIKKEVSRIAARLLFDQNVQSTWNRFRGQVEPFLDSVKARLGLTDFKVVLDETTTTPDLIDRNIMYAKIFLKPARAIEFIAIDFVITNSGASFED